MPDARDEPALQISCADASSRPWLAELTIRDFAIVDALQVQWAPGLSVLTGETGAGKSIIIDALGAALGDRFEQTWLRSGADRGTIEAIFWGFEAGRGVVPLLDELGCDVEDDQVIFTRDVQATRSTARINGRAVPMASVQQVGELLIDVHSQASHLSLSRVPEHLAMLDRYARAGALRDRMATAARRVRQLRSEIDRVRSGDRQAERERELLSHEVEEIDAASPRADEETELQAQRSRFKNALRLRQLAMAVHDALEGGDEGSGALGSLGDAAARLDEIASLDTGAAADGGRLVEAIDAAEEIARGMRRYADGIEDDPDALEALEERALLLAELKRKYGSTLADVLAYRDNAAARLHELEHSEERIAALIVDEDAAVREAAECAIDLSRLRGEAADALEGLVKAEMAAVGMPGALFSVQIKRTIDPAGLPVGGGLDCFAFDETGIDRVELLMSANAGEPPRPLAQVASGGELARFMLALKSAVSTVDETPVLVFDELDQGVGGRMGHVIGEKLWRLSRDHQVICITHLPQVAAYADAHFAVVKAVEKDRTVTRVERLENDARVREIGQMLGGAASSTTIQETARELLEAATRRKMESGVAPQD